MSEQRPCGPDGRHEAPEPDNEPTACPCGVVRRFPAPKEDPGGR